MKTIAVYPGSFDPISKGHLDIITRSADLFDELYVLVSVNANKTYMFNADERVEMIKKSIFSPYAPVQNGSSSFASFTVSNSR